MLDIAVMKELSLVDEDFKGGEGVGSDQPMKNFGVILVAKIGVIEPSCFLQEFGIMCRFFPYDSLGLGLASIRPCKAYSR